MGPSRGPELRPMVGIFRFRVDQVNEFTEYASLVRSIRVENTAELAWKLLSTPDDDDDDSDLDEGSTSTPKSRRRSKSVKSSGPNDDDDNRSDGESEISYDSDDSTSSKFDARWPLGPDEVVVPKWHLRDEILSFARATAPREPMHDFEAHSVSRETQERLENDILQPVPQMIEDMLVFVVDLMAVHIPPVTDTLQDRIRPIGWEHVINVVSGALHGKEQGPLTSEMIKDAKTRLEGMYGPPKANLRFMDLPVEPDSKGYARKLAFPAGIPKHVHTFSTSMDAAESVLAIPEPLEDLRRKRKAFLEHIGNTRKRRRRGDDLESIHASTSSPAPTPLASEDDEIDELDSDSE